MVSILLIILILIFFVFIFADYKILRAFFLNEKDRNVSFTASQLEGYINSGFEDKISEEFIEEVIDDVINNAEIDSNITSDIDEKSDSDEETYDNF